MQKIILYYIFRPIKDPEAIKLWQKELASHLNLKGRIIISEAGINGSLGGDLEDLKKYIKQNKEYPSFKEIAYKWSDGSREDFPKLSVKVRPELVSFKLKEKLKVNHQGVVGGGKHLKPDQVHELVDKYKDKVVFLDGRNEYEAKIGRFKDAYYFKTKTSKDFNQEIESGKFDHLKSKKVITYCTGGIRCEILTNLLYKKGFKDVYQIDGGIVKYLEKYGQNGLWEGNLFVFDKRLGIKYGEDIGECQHCQAKTSQYLNCHLKSCNRLVLICSNCQNDPRKLYDQDECFYKDQTVKT